jgi:hypothetical protein
LISRIRLKQIGLDGGVFLVADLAHLALHLGFQQAIAQRPVVVHLRLGGGDDGLQRPLMPEDHQRIQEKHT